MLVQKSMKLPMMWVTQISNEGSQYIIMPPDMTLQLSQKNYLIR